MSKHSGSSKRWLQRQHKDPYVKQAQQSHYRSRAIYKLIEIDEKDRLFKKGQTVIDLGAVPGSWTQYASERVGPSGRVIAVDILDMEPVPNTLFIKGDFTEPATHEVCIAQLGGSRADLVISDMAPNLSGIKSSDQARSIGLAELARDMACDVLSKNGDLLVKVFEGAGIAEFRRELREHFRQVLTRKPRASRTDSREFYLLARGFG